MSQLFLLESVGGVFEEMDENEKPKVMKTPKVFARLERKPGYYISTIVLPCFFFGFLNCANFALSMPDLGIA